MQSRTIKYNLGRITRTISTLIGLFSFYGCSQPTNVETALDSKVLHFGLGAERRLARNVWLGVEVGVGGFRGLRLSGSDVESPDLDVSTAAYVDVALKFRPSLSF